MSISHYEVFKVVVDHGLNFEFDIESVRGYALACGAFDGQLIP